MYVIQDRVEHLKEVLDPHSLPQQESQKGLMCRSHGQEKLCDGFVCYEGSDCLSGCCATFGMLKQDYCQPLIAGECPVAGFTYGPLGDSHYRENLEAVPDSIEDIPLPPEFNEDGTGSNPPEEQKSENKFWKGVLIGVSAWVGVVIALLSAYCLCRKNSVISVEQQSQY